MTTIIAKINNIAAIFMDTSKCLSIWTSLRDDFCCFKPDDDEMSSYRDFL